MNTNALKKFAQQARRKLLEQVAARLDYVLQTDSAELREKAGQIKKLQEAINRSSKEQVIEKVAYTWFNRLMALRFMDANDYQPLGIKVLSPKPGYTLPEILDEAKQGNIPGDLPVNQQHIYDLLDGKITSSNPQNEAYKALLTGACNHLNKVFPFLFERINDHTELLLPDDLISEFSIVEDMRKGMTDEDCKEVEIIGWLYQFYISELNDDLIGSKKKYKKEDIAPASQLFTPKWIVEYMVDNTLGQLWTEINPTTKVTESLDFYIKPAYREQLEKRTSKSVEEIKFFEPCVGSGHILSYAFDVFYKMYEEEGYNPSEIPELIVTKNLYGVDIDQRAAQLASFVLLMKGRQKHRRFLRNVERKQLQPNITFYRDFEFDNKFNNASVLGSLIKVDPNEADAIEVDETSLFGERQKELKKLYQYLGQRYDVVVTNPPYISSSRMEVSLKQYVETNYPETKSDLFATFILRNLELTNENGLTGYMTPFVWMFISSYEKLRNIIINKHFINNLIQLEYSGFDGATVPICTFTLRKKYIENGKGSYIRLSDFKGAKLQAPKTLEAIQNPDCGWFYTANQKDFKKVPRVPIGYWLKNNVSVFDKDKLGESFMSGGRNKTHNNVRFVRFFWENKKNDKNWIKYSNGGEFKRWYGNEIYIVKWDDFAQDYYSAHGGLINSKFFNKNGITWNLITSALNGFRIKIPESVYSSGSPTIFNENFEYDYNVLGFLNSKVAQTLLKLINPSLNTTVGDVLSLPLINGCQYIVSLVSYSIEFSKKHWDSRETSWDFTKNELIKHKGQDLEESIDLYRQYWKNKFYQLHRNEEELNKQFIEIYGLQEELTPDVPLEDITILKDELDQNALKTSSDSYHSGWKLENDEWKLEEKNPYPELPFNAKEIIRQFISYAVGCMFGRYSLDKEGLILANQGETLDDYLQILHFDSAQCTFMPDADNIIPILDDEWFEDDITARFYEFLKASFGKRDFDRNLHFIEDTLGKSVRKYFLKDFYTDHIKRYKKRPIYWMFSSPKGSFNVLIYMHRYTPDTLNRILRNYLKQYREKLKTHITNLDHLIVNGSNVEQTRAAKEKDKTKAVLMELQEYEQDILYPLATERISIDLDDGVLVNYNKFGQAIKAVMGLNDKKAKEKVRNFDWIDTTTII